ncbi:DUF4232 domain-containing protein [Acaricomes phytoseiuli]|uniref:DUF4232 domain-containing protein n=1 Tax=Acaricomes phytoseiuli TaxID=291968 RepID=UPI00037F237D|nr:DUF4232 domain-containing protein [Acaricomes phytoseiuli]MCW1249216.1 DUF4232 domain-containing protein [Acaricomes phytoseiuli]
MSEHGRVSPAVYRRRRLVAGMAALVIVFLVGWAVVSLISGLSGGSGSQAAGTDSTPTASVTSAPAATTETESGSASPSTAPASSAPPCDPAQISLAASTDAPSYNAGQNPVLTLTVTNTGSAACELNLGTSQMEFLVNRGEDRVFSSTDCRQDPQDLQRTLASGATEKANFSWNRTRSVPGCTPVPEIPPAGPGSTYTLTVKLGAMMSPPEAFVLAS